MRILIDLTSLVDNFSGIERYAASIAYNMIKQDKNQYILIFKNEIHCMFREYVNKDNIEIVIIQGGNKLIFNQFKLPNIIRKKRADWYLFMAFPVPVLLFKKNMISTIHDICCWDCPKTMERYSEIYFKISHIIAVKKCKYILTISEFSEDRIVNKINYPREKIWRIYCGIDKKFYNFMNSTEFMKEISEKYNLPDKYILSLSTLEPRKNLRLLIEAYRELVIEYNVETKLVLAGRKGWKVDEILDGIEESVKKRIIFTGFIDDNDLPYIYGNAYIFVFSSMYEGFGMPPLEAMSTGTLVVSSNAASMPEILGDSAIYFENQDKESLKKKIHYALNLDNVTRSKYIKSGFENVKKYSWKKEADKLLKLLYSNFKIEK